MGIFFLAILNLAKWYWVTLVINEVARLLGSIHDADICTDSPIKSCFEVERVLKD